MRGLSLPVRRGSVVWPGGMLLLYFHHATAVDLCNRDRNPSTDGVPNRTASYSVTRLAQNSSRLQPESRSIGHKTRPSLPPRYCLSPCHAFARLALATVSQRVFESSRLTKSRISSDRICNQLGLFCTQAISPVRGQLYISSFAWPWAYATRFLRRKGYSYAMLSGSNFWQASAHG
jgi:hypothetical protein